MKLYYCQRGCGVSFCATLNRKFFKPLNFGIERPCRILKWHDPDSYAVRLIRHMERSTTRSHSINPLIYIIWLWRACLNRHVPLSCLFIFLNQGVPIAIGNLTNKSTYFQVVWSKCSVFAKDISNNLHLLGRELFSKEEVKCEEIKRISNDFVTSVIFIISKQTLNFCVLVFYNLLLTVHFNNTIPHEQNFQ